MESSGKSGQHWSASGLRSVRASPLLLDQTLTLPTLSTPSKMLISLQARSVSPLTIRSRSPLIESGKLPNTRHVFERHKIDLRQKDPQSKLQQSLLVSTKSPNRAASPFLPTFRPTDLNKRKHWLRKQLLKYYHVKISLYNLRHLSESQLCELALHRRRMRLASLAAHTMLQWLRSRRLLKAMSAQRTRMHMGAYLIQQHWKRYIVYSTQACVKRPREAMAKRWESAVTIQRVYRGYVARERFKAVRLMADLDKMHKYYVGVEEAIRREKASKILMAWRRFRIAKKIARRIHEAKQTLVAETVQPQSKWDFKPIINKADGGKKAVTRLAAERPASIKTNPSWKQKALEVELGTPSMQRMKSRDEPASPAMRRRSGTNQPPKMTKRGSTASTEPNTPISSGIESRLRNEKEKLLIAGLDKIDEVEV